MSKFVKMVENLVKPGADILSSLTPEKCDLLHMAIGISGEAAEVLGYQHVINMREELGDILFYLCGHMRWNRADDQVEKMFNVLFTDCFDDQESPILTFLEVGSRNYGDTELSSWMDIADNRNGKTIAQLVIAAGEILDKTKKYVIYNKKDYQNYSYDYFLLGLSILGIEKSFGFSHYAVLDSNINKLSNKKTGRYSSGGYSDQQALDRKDKKE